MRFASAQHKHTFLRDLQAHLAAVALVPEHSEPAPSLVSKQLQELLVYLGCTLEFYEAVPVGADLTHVLDRWFLWLLEDELGAYETSEPVAALYRRRLAGDEPLIAEWKAATAAAAAAAAATAAAYAAATAAAATAAGAAAAAYAVTEQAECLTRMRSALLKIVGETEART